ncbi:MAG: TetR/AcrR family transcriptional regulator C-terminal domain-containing protein [Sphingobium sp.]
MDQRDIVTKALTLLNEVGLEGITTRRLAKALDVKGPSLYYHISSMQELFGHMANTLIVQATDSVDIEMRWSDWLRATAMQIRNVLLEYRDGARLLTAAWPDEEMRGQTIPRLAAPLIREGIAVNEAQEAVAMMASFTIGWMMNEQNSDIRRLMVTQMNVDAAFERSIATILVGLAARFGLSAPAASQLLAVSHH